MRVHVKRVLGGLAAGVLIVAGLAEAGGAAYASGSSGSWDKAIEVPGTSSLNAGGNAYVSSVSCTSRGYCAAVGNYANAPGDDSSSQGFVVSRQNGKWGKARQVPGITALGGGSLSQLDSVSCASPGNCTAGGFYFDSSTAQWAFVVTERNGKWGNAMQVAHALNIAGFGEVYSVSCPSVGNCAATGYYGGGPEDSSTAPFVINQRNGTWGAAIEVPGSAALNVINDSRANSISCSSAGNCALGGFYLDASGGRQAFVASERNGTWHSAIEVPGTAAVNLGGQAAVYSVSCSAAGDCAAGGYYEASVFNVDTQRAKWQAFVVTERNGSWAKAVPVLHTPSINDNVPGAGAQSVSCPSTGHCTASGAFIDGSGRLEAFVVGQSKGKWGTATIVPGTGALNAGDQAEAPTVSCPSAGNCVIGGSYTSSGGHSQAFLASQRNGKWSKAIEVPGTKRLNVGGDAAVNSVSCPAVGKCSAGGFAAHQAFVVSQG
ncbi:MAG TPA: hypothetical protein VGM14_15235 [Streptosporangiaceae bacterium]